MTGAWDYENLVSLASAEVYDPATEAWEPTGSMASPRYCHTATLLPNGRVLVSGGTTNDAVNPMTATAEEYDPGAASWHSAGSMEVPRAVHEAMLLAAGKVLIAGGSGGKGELASAELYDPITGTWARTVAMNMGRQRARAAALGSGQVLVTGGDNSAESFWSAELYDLLLVDLAIGSVTPSSGPSTGGTQVTITGGQFATGATVGVGGAPATNVTVLDATTITFITPPGTPGARDVMVVNPDGQFVVSAGGFTYVAPPSLTFLWPSSGPASGGTLVSMSGSGFTTGATVAVGGVPATGVVVVDSTSITFTTAPGQP